MFSLTIHFSIYKNLPSYQLLHHDIEFGNNSGPRLPLHDKLTYTPLYWKWSANEVPVFIFDIHSFLMPPLSGSVYHELVALNWNSQISFLLILLIYLLATIKLYKVGIAFLRPSFQASTNDLMRFIEWWPLSCHFLYAWLAKNVDTYKLGSEASSSSGMKQCFVITTYSYIMEHDLKYYFVSNTLHLRGNITHAFHDGWYKMLSPQLTINVLMIPKGNETKLQIVHFGEPLEPFIPLIEDDPSRIKIPKIDVIIPITPIATIPILSTAPSTKVTNEVKEHSNLNLLRYVDKSLSLISMLILDVDHNAVELRLEGSKGGAFAFNDDVIIKEVDENVAQMIGQAIVSCTALDGLHTVDGDFNSLYAFILQKGLDITPLKNKAEGLIKIYRRATLVKRLLKNKLCHIDIINATKVMDTATKGSLEKIKAYIKESFEDPKHF
ncbi:LOW QUALITY PROTEIN: hypothetical protein Cgig2_012708 [Carnegiea gigantea]|uniref:Uncharacterized protein n=1 Tax=Carnegiea gigantea TaxID=171969 RepID=A0A9Q1JQD8_9CARY|nr:LOW QUALITY PROTEIN: hypothetical protein Cgig2_012708 [Carnegiea gigantea]